MKNLVLLLYFCINTFIISSYDLNAQWVQSNGAYGGTVLDMLADGSNLYTATRGGGVFISTNDGTNWTSVSNGLTNPYVISLAKSGTNLFAGTTTIYGGSGGGAYRSTDNGNSWTLIISGLTAGYSTVNSFAVIGSDLFAGTDYLNGDGGVFLTTNSGTNWTLVSSGLPADHINALAVIGTNLFAGTSGNGVYLSTNNGSSWNPVNTGLTNLVTGDLVVSGTNLLIGTNDGVFLSTNNGGSWTQVNSGLTNPYVYSLAVSGTNLFAGTEQGVFLTTNNGTSWTQVSSGLTNRYIYSLEASGSELFAGTFGGGVFHSSNNGTSWSPANNGIAGGDIRSFAISGDNFFVGTGGGSAFRSTDGGASWVDVGLYNEWIYSMAAKPNGSGGANIYAGTMGDGVFMSTDMGTTWNQSNNGITVPLIWSLAVIPSGSDTNIFAGTWGGGVFYSTNNGANWIACGPIPGAPLISGIVYDEGYIYVGSWSSGVMRSSDYGTTWMPVNAGLTNTFVNALFIEQHNIFASTIEGTFLSTDNGTNWSPVNSGLSSDVYAFISTDGVIFGATASSSVESGGVYLSTDFGTNWASVSEGLINTNLRCLAIVGTNLFTGSYGGGLYQRPLSEMIPVELTSFTAIANESTIELHWSTATETNNQGFEIERKFSDNEFEKIGSVVGFGTTTEPKSYSYTDENLTTGAYAYRLKQIDYDGTFEYSDEIIVEVSIPAEFLLSQNYPNPFNPTTKIKYSVPETGNVKLTVYNIVGEEIAVLIDGTVEAGYYEITFDATNLPSGLYLYKLQSGKNVEIKKMILTK